MFTFSAFLWLMVIITVVYFFWTLFIFPIFLSGFVGAIYESIKNIDEKSLLLYILKKVFRYILWVFATVILAFLFGGIFLKIFDYIIFDLLFEAIKNFIGIS